MAELEDATLEATAEVKWPGASIPATFSNLFHVVVGPVTTRLVFSEGLAGETINTHTAIVMPTADAADLARILTDTIAANRAQNPLPQESYRSAIGTVVPDGK